jgi:hypothetical protein
LDNCTTLKIALHDVKISMTFSFEFTLQKSETIILPEIWKKVKKMQYSGGYSIKMLGYTLKHSQSKDIHTVHTIYF